MVVKPDLALEPFGVLVGRGGQRLQRRPVELLEQLPPAGAQVPGHLAVEPIQQLPDRGVQLGQREEAPPTQPGVAPEARFQRDDPTLDELHADLDLGLVAGPVRTRRNDRGVGVGGEVGLGPVDLRLVEAGLRDPGLARGGARTGGALRPSLSETS